MRRTACGLAMIGLLGVYFLPGCGDAGKARVDVAKKMALDQIDDALGKTDVQKAEIDNGIKSAKKAADGVRKAKIKAQVGLEQLDEKVRPHRRRSPAATKRSSSCGRRSGPTGFGGKTYTVAKLKEIAGKVIQSRREVEGRVKGFDTARENMRTVVATITKQQQELDARIAKLQATDTKLEAEMSAARAMKQGSAATAAARCPTTWTTSNRSSPPSPPRSGASWPGSRRSGRPPSPIRPSATWTPSSTRPVRRATR